jgi:hypothetical protein
MEVRSIKRRGLDPWAYLKHVLTELPARPAGTDLADLLPDQWVRYTPETSTPLGDLPRCRLPVPLLALATLRVHDAILLGPARCVHRTLTLV